MTTKAALSILLVTLFSQAFAQNLFVGSYAEKTKVSPKAGIQAGYTFGTGHEVGAFYQQEAEMLGAGEVNKPRFYEQEFFGVFFAAPVYSFQKGQVKCNVRTGVTNKVNFAITPSVLVNYELLNRIHLNGGVGVRAFRPTLQAGIRINLF